nr:hypothetical protein [Pseudopedobacter sp.]
MQYTNHPLLQNKSAYSLALFEHFVSVYQTIGTVELNATKSMIGIHNGKKNITWITELGKNSFRVFFPFKRTYNYNLCFHKIAQVPSEIHQFNHHLRVFYPEDINEEVIEFMKLAYRS